VDMLLDEPRQLGAQNWAGAGAGTLCN
jgi:hypothetical protein